MSSSTITQKIRFTILIKIWMNSSCHLLPSCKKLDATENSTRSNRKVKSATEPMHFHLVARLWVALFIWICKFHLSVTSRIVFIVIDFLHYGRRWHEIPIHIFVRTFYALHMHFPFGRLSPTPSVLKYKAFNGSKFVPKYKAS
jgi:hypothetical protein